MPPRKPKQPDLPDGATTTETAPTDTPDATDALDETVEILTPRMIGTGSNQDVITETRTRILDGWDYVTGTWATGSPVARILDMIRAGNHPKIAAAFGGIKGATLATWLSYGQEFIPSDDEFLRAEVVPEMLVYVDFLIQVETAAASSEMELVTIVRRAALKDGRLALDLLDRRFPERWRKQRELTVHATNDVDPRNLVIDRVVQDPNMAFALGQLAHRIEDVCQAEEKAADAQVVTATEDDPET
jgi:hypothetical protein